MSQFINTDPVPLTDKDFTRASARLNCDVAAVKAVAEIESGRAGGYLPSGRPVILFESRLFNVFTGGRYLKLYPHLATARWVRNYRGGDAEYQRLEEALTLAPEAALRACSWGRFQVLGDNYRRLGFGSVHTYVTSVVDDGESSHLDHFVSFVIINRIDDELRRDPPDFDGFSRVYNGPGYRKHNYQGRMQSSYARFLRGDVMMHDGKLMTNKDLQRALMRHGYLPPKNDDGIIGPMTRAGLQVFEVTHDLKVNGVVDGTEWEALLKEAA
jgi:peptidoglycan hydrolase-like protein with peptidoglycan-binding domain